jgi:3',5'-cyclic-AMP phosphodiesterase
MNRRRFLKTTAVVLGAMAAGCANVPAEVQEQVRAAATAAGESPAGAAQAVAAPAASADGTPSPTADRPVRVALLSDLHLQPEDSGLAKTINVKFAKAAEDLRAFEPDLWIANGDVADHGLTSEMEAFKKMIGKVTSLDRVMATTGNHEFYDMEATDEELLNRWRQAFGVEQPYSSRVFGGVHFVLLADEQWHSAPYNQDWCWITAAQLKWFEQTLAAHRDLFTIVCMHQPLNETVVGSIGARPFGGTNYAKEIYAILEQNPQVKLWFSGHTHRKLEYEGQVVEKNGITFMGLGSTIYLLGRTADGRNARDNTANQSRFLEIYPDRVRVRARDHVAGRWLDELERTVKRGAPM